MNNPNKDRFSGDPKADISRLRQAIDGIDEKILDLINQRLSLAKKIGDLKKHAGLQISDSRREAEILNRLLEKNNGPMTADTLRNIFEAIIAEGRNVQRTDEQVKTASKIVDSNTSFLGLIGNPVVHSLSPVMHNQAFAATGYNGIYLAFRVIDPAAAIKGIRAFNFRGISVTLPHKVAVLEYLDEIDDTAARIGAVNTIVNNQGKLIGYNTDCAGALEALRTRTSIKDKSVALIGAGGAARAIGFGLVTDGGRVTIFNRSRAPGERLAEDLQAEFLPLNAWQPERYEILINATPVGMHPATDAIAIPKKDLSEEMVVMDIVYNPLETRLLKEAAAKGCRTISGVDMFVFQGAQQFELWTGQTAPVDVMRDAVLQALKRN